MDNDLNRKVIETVPIFFFIYNIKKKKIEFISPQFFEIAEGIQSVETPEPLKKSIHPDYHQAFENFFADLSEKNHFEGSVELKADERLKGIEWVELNAFPVKKEGGQLVDQVVGHIVNISEKKKQYEELKEEKEHISNMLNMVAHDLRAPFNRVQMIAQLLEGNLGQEELKKNKVYLDMLRKQGDQATGLISSLLRLATLKGRASSLDMNLHDLRDLVKDNLEDFKDKLEEKRIELKLKFPDESVKAKLDAVLFHQVLSNLMSNAVKYTPEGGRITFHLSYRGRHVELLVEDTGMGIPEKYQQDLFKGVFALRRKGLEGEHSTGLGLFICNEIVKMHQGIIDVESKEGEGSTFRILLPFPESSAAYY